MKVLCALLGGFLLAASTTVDAGDLQKGGLAYARGDYTSAIAEFRPLADGGDPVAQYKLGVMYACGLGVQEDDAQAALWYKKAAEKGYVDAQYMLGQIYSKGKGAQKNDASAIAWYSKAAEQGDLNAQFELGQMYFSGSGIGQDHAQAASWLRKSALQGNAGAEASLGLIYLNGQGMPVDREQAISWLRKASEQGNPDAQYNLGVMYLDGTVVHKDSTKAVALLREAASRYNVQAESSLGLIYLNGKDVPQDDVQAAAWFFDAAGKKDVSSQYHLGLMYATGQGVPKNLVTADALLALSASSNEPDPTITRLADISRSALEQGMTQQQQAEARALSDEMKHKGMLGALLSRRQSYPAAYAFMYMVPKPIDVEIDHNRLTHIDHHIMGEPLLRSRFMVLAQVVPQPKVQITIQGNGGDPVLKQALEVVTASAKSTGFSDVEVSGQTLP